GAEAAFLAEPAFGSRIGRVDADVDDLGLLDAPVAHGSEPLMVPIRVGDQVDGDADAERAGEFERLEIAAERYPLAVFGKPLVVERLEPEEHVRDAKPLPEAEHRLVAQQHVAAGFEVIVLSDAGPGDRVAQLHPLPL